nr:hypothetical protein [Candidatus Freyarchaeota archaeon]
MDGNSRNNTIHHKGKSRLLRGKTKHVLLALSAILILAFILAIPLASGQFGFYALPQANSIDPSGGISIKDNQMITLGGTASSNGLSLVGNMTTIGDTTLNGLLNVSKFGQIVLGPLTTTRSQNITADLIEINKKYSAGDTITLTGTPSNPSIVNLCGNINIGNESGDKEVFMNMDKFYQYVNSNSEGYIGTSRGSNDLPLNTLDAIKVTKGELHIFGMTEVLGIPLVPTDIYISKDRILFVALDFIPYSINLNRYGGVANVSYLKDSGAFVGIGWLLSLFITDVIDVHYLEWEEPTTFEAWGPWFRLNRGVVSMQDSYVQMKSNDTINFRFLDSSTTNAGFRITKSAHYSKAVMNATTQQQVVNGKGLTYLTNGSTALTGATIKNLSQMVNCELTFQGNMTQTGNITVQGNIGITGRNYMKGNISIRSPLLRLTNGVMDTTGTMSIAGGAISIPTGTMVMNNTGSFITGNTITVTGNVDFTGDATITGNIRISGRNYMQGNITVAQLSLTNGVMDTNGDMNITDGNITVMSGHMVMNSSGSFIMDGTTTVTGTISFEGDPTITGEISLSGYNYMQGLISVNGDMNINNGLTTGSITLTIDGTMETTGTMTITNGEIIIPSGSMVMNDSGSYIIGDTITVTGDQIASQGTTEVNGDISMTGDIGISGYNHMEGLITVQGYLNINNGLTSGTITLTIASTMDTTGTMTITNGEISIPNGHMVMNDSGSYIIGDTITVTGDQIASQGTTEVNGDITIQGDIGISGHNYMQGNIKIRYPLLNLNGVMDTTGTMTITNGAINVQNGHMVMEDTDSYITGDTITVTGIIDFNGDAAITGDIVISGHNYMEGNINIRYPLLSLNGVMVTDGDMSITNGASINIQNGHMVMNDAGSFITGDTITVTGTVNFNGGATITGDIGISGYSYMEGLITVQGYMNINNGLTTGSITLTIASTMETTGTMTITNGEISIPSGSMVMNDAGSFITGDTITVTGDQIASLGTTEVNGDITMTGDIGISGYSYMEGLITVQGYMNINNGLTSGTITLTIDGTMETTGSMNILNGEISVPGGSIVMNSTGAYITSNSGITVTGDQIASLGTIEVNGDTTMKGDFAMGGTSYIKGPVSISGSLNINFGTMMGTGTITVSDGFMQTVGNMQITDATITVHGKIVMDSSGTHIGSTTSITGDTITVNGIVTNAGSVKMTGTFVLMIPMSMTGVMVTNGITAMGGLGTINGIMNVMGNIMMSGMTV